jgi:ankyrin repeat protein
MNYYFSVLLFLSCIFASGCGTDSNKQIPEEGEKPDVSNASAQAVSNAEVLRKLEEFSNKLEQIDEIRADLVTFQSKLNSPVDFDSISHSNSEEVVRIQKTDSNLLDASAIGDLLRVKELLSEGINPNSKDKTGKTPLHYAASNGRSEIITALIEAGAKINELDNDKLTPLNRAQFIGNEAAIKVLLENKAVAAEIINPATAKGIIIATAEQVLQSVEQDSLDLFKKQEKLGFNFASELPGNQSFLMATAKNGSLNILQYFFEKNNPQKDSRNTTVVIEALNSMSQRAIGENADKMLTNYREVVRLLLKNVPESINEVKDGYSPLHMAISTHDVSMMKILLDAKVNVEQKGPNGSTPLIMAVTAPDHTHENGSGDTEINHERHGHQLEMAELLLGAGAKINEKGYKGRDAIMEAIKSGNSKIAEMMLKLGANPNSEDTDGVTCLHLAAYSGHKNLCEQLLAKNANKDAAVKVGPKKGLKPIDAAREGNHQNIVTLFQSN